ncbi:DMT family transporter [Propionibacterium acidifaciens]|uniref:DMT family transporter n=1 Tax=Propionibacterium acidifaciens TaxID=556499 RepID=UPI0009DE03C1|nr:DMT family transporter [Propionibacterium acidifaciens]AYW79079.1 DMT family transporter [Propionibacterium acidifaciens]
MNIQHGFIKKKNTLKIQKTKAIIYVIFAVCCLALGGVFVRLSEVGPIATGGFRSLIAAPILFLLSILGQHRSSKAKLSLRDHAIIAAGGFLLAADLCLWNVSFFYTTLAESNLLANLVPFIVAIYGWVFYRTVPDKRLAIPALFALGGLALLALANAHLNPTHVFGDVLALSTAFFYAGFLVVAKELRERYPAMHIMSILSLWCASGCFAAALLRGEKLIPQTWRGWLLLVILAITSQILGQTLMAHAVRFLPLQLASLFVLLQPIAAALYAYILFKEKLALPQIIGIIILLGAIYRSKTILESES